MPSTPERRRELRALNPEQYRVYARMRWAQGRQRIVALKNKPCADCGIQYPPYVMDFDHRPGEVKMENVGAMSRFSEEAIAAEIAKCDLVCANCHRERTFGHRKESPDGGSL